MSPLRIELVDHLHVVVFFEFVDRQDAELVAGAEKNDRNHVDAGEIEGVGPSEGKIVRHREGSTGSGTDPRSMAPQMSNLGRDHREREAAVAARSRSRPFTG
jgi:hypothetical protein